MVVKTKQEEIIRGIVVGVVILVIIYLVHFTEVLNVN